MAEVYCYEGIRNGATYKVAEATKTTIEAKPSEIIGKVVTLTGNKEVGYGSAGDEPLGFVEQVEKEHSGSDVFVVSVVWNQAREDIPCAGSESVPSFVACDGKGGLQAASSTTSAKLYDVDTDAKTCTVYIHG